MAGRRDQHLAARRAVPKAKTRAGWTGTWRVALSVAETAANWACKMVVTMVYCWAAQWVVETAGCWANMTAVERVGCSADWWVLLSAGGLESPMVARRDSESAEKRAEQKVVRWAYDLVD